MIGGAGYNPAYGMMAGGYPPGAMAGLPPQSAPPASTDLMSNQGSPATYLYNSAPATLGGMPLSYSNDGLFAGGALYTDPRTGLTPTTSLDGVTEMIGNQPLASAQNGPVMVGTPQDRVTVNGKNVTDPKTGLPIVVANVNNRLMAFAGGSPYLGPNGQWAQANNGVLQLADGSIAQVSSIGMDPNASPWNAGGQPFNGQMNYRSVRVDGTNQSYFGLVVTADNRVIQPNGDPVMDGSTQVVCKDGILYAGDKVWMPGGTSLSVDPAPITPEMTSTALKDTNKKDIFNAIVSEIQSNPSEYVRTDNNDTASTGNKSVSLDDFVKAFAATGFIGSANGAKDINSLPVDQRGPILEMYNKARLQEWKDQSAIGISIPGFFGSTKWGVNLDWQHLLDPRSNTSPTLQTLMSMRDSMN